MEKEFTREQLTELYATSSKMTLIDMVINCNEKIKKLETEIETKNKIQELSSVALYSFRKWQKKNWKDVYLMSNEFMVGEYFKYLTTN